jgi:putative endonuclease
VEINKRELGAQYEDKAARYLENKGIRILERNFRNRFGEIDIIGFDRNTYLFVEVKYRKDNRFGEPACAVNLKKQRTICKIADYYRVCHHIGDNRACRFDVIAICGEEIEWYENAFLYIGK